MCNLTHHDLTWRTGNRRAQIITGQRRSAQLDTECLGSLNKGLMVGVCVTNADADADAGVDATASASASAAAAAASASASADRKQGTGLKHNGRQSSKGVRDGVFSATKCFLQQRMTVKAKQQLAIS
jgi:hypothetical protein